MKKLKKILLEEGCSVRDAMRAIDQGAVRVAIILSSDNRLVGTITDGDIRRALLSGCELNDPAIDIINRNPKIGRDGQTKEEFLDVLEKFDLLVLPIVDDKGFFIRLETVLNIIKPPKYDNPVFIMAGGFGSRLRPLTDNCPKPMLKVGERPMLEHLLLWFKSQGFHNFYFSTHYLPNIIKDYFGDGSSFGVSVRYVHENEPLGTGGALGLLPKDISSLPIILMNGDVLTKVDFVKMLEFHRLGGFRATICVRELEHQVPFGVIETSDDLIKTMVEKPTYTYHINTGIYVLDNECINDIVPNTKLDMPSFLETLMQKQQLVGAYPSFDYWLDIGRKSDFQKAQEDILNLY
jgi:dTDP-glucose pyrophosphorylase/CBS domain-containing protein